MVDTIETLERLREELGISKTRMAERLGDVTPQQYQNWVARKKLPKEYHLSAMAMIYAHDGSGAAAELEILKVLPDLSDEQVKLILSLIRNIKDA